MDVAILFWFYKEVDVCRNHLEFLRTSNPDAKIYGLFGGNSKEDEIYKKLLGEYLDDFYVSKMTEDDSDTKWIHGDVMILDWFVHRGQDLMWDSVAVVQWDMLVFEKIKTLFPDLQKGQIFLSGLRELTEDIEIRWHWTRPDGDERATYLAFQQYMKKEYGYTRNPYLCCLFIFQILPREFFEKWQTISDPYVGMLEYKIPTFADYFNIPFYKKDMGVWWFEENGATTLPLNASPKEIQRAYIENQLTEPDGYRLFHPFFKKW